jgi:hypothetical protein
MGCSWAKMYQLMGHGGPIRIGKSIRFIYIYFFRILHRYVSKMYPTCIGIGYVSRYPIHYGLMYPCFVGPRRLRNQVPRAIRQQSLVCFFHSVTPVGVCEPATDIGRDRRHIVGGVVVTESCRQSTGLVTPTARRVTIRWVLRGSRATTTGW